MCQQSCCLLGPLCLQVLFLLARTCLGDHPLCPHDHGALGPSFLKPVLLPEVCLGLEGIWELSLDQH